MALSEPEKATLLEIVGINDLATLNYLLSGASSAQLERLSEDIDSYDRIKDKHLRVKGGKDGIDLDNERKRAAIRERCAVHLRLNNSGGATMLVRA
jgi:hypothetical protein